MITNDLHLCPQCKTDLPVAAFYPSAIKRQRNGRWCKACMRKAIHHNRKRKSAS